MRILNLYAGIGGNRKLWPITDKDEVVAVELNPEIAAIYQSFFPKDKVIIADAHQYLLEHYKEFDFIWSSPPCPTHSTIRKYFHTATHYSINAVYPDMKLYQEILFLQGYFEGKWVVENVISWYNPLIRPFELERHYFWSNFVIPFKNIINDRRHADLDGATEVYGFDLKDFKINDKRTLLRNCVNPELALYIWNCAFKEKQLTISEV